MSEGQLSLAEIAGVNLDDVEEFRFENLPVGAYTFQVVEAGLDEVGSNGKLAAIFKTKVLETHGLVGLPDGEDESNYVGKDHRETFFVSEAQDIGRIKAFLKDIGLESSGVTLGDAVASAESHVFSGRIKHRTSPQDKSVKYANIVLDKKAEAKDA
jgi:hypothetical protein